LTSSSLSFLIIKNNLSIAMTKKKVEINTKAQEKKTEQTAKEKKATQKEHKAVQEELSTEDAAEQIKAEIESLNEEVSELKDKNLRLMAEFDNFRKRSLKERTDLIKYGGEGVLKNILPLIDDFERALQAMESASDVEAVKEGVDLIYTKFIAFLGENGVQEIRTKNEVFDTDLHEAVTTFPVEDEDAKGKIIDCLAKGYTLNEKVIRFAKVVVGE
jgi:molecular chaperone GrpE